MNAHRLVVLPADRGPRQRSKIMQVLAAVEGDGVEPLAELLVVGLPRLRRGMTAVVVTPSRDRAWVRALGGLRGRGIGCLVVLVDAAGGGQAPAPASGTGGVEAPAGGEDAELWAVRYALAEHEVRHHIVRPGRSIGAQLVEVGGGR